MNRLLSGIVLCCCTLAAITSSRATEKIDYLKQIKPILSAKCYSCHGALKQEGRTAT